MNQHERHGTLLRLPAERGRLDVAAAKLAVVADATKLGVRTFARICPPADIDVPVTDDRAADGAREFEEQGMSVVRA